MMRSTAGIFATFLLAVLCSLNAAAEVVCDTMPPGFNHFKYHLRVESRKTSSAKILVHLGAAYTLDFTVPSLADAADNIPAQVRLAVRDSDGATVAKKVGSCTVVPREKGFSIVIEGTPRGFKAAVGGPKEEVFLEVDADSALTFPVICADVPEKSRVIRRTLTYEEAAAPRQGHFDSEEALREYLRRSDDPREGFYTYLDKNIDATGPAAVSRPEYKLACVKSPDAPGGYTLLYMGGGRPGWKALEVKATLTPTGFIDHFDLRWIDAFRRLHSDDCSAEFSAGGAILAVKFPLLAAEVRFRRMLPR